MTSGPFAPSDPELRQALDARGREAGFGLVGVTTPEPSGHMPRYRSWLAEGAHGEMAYLARGDAVRRRADLRGTMDEVRSVIVVTHDYPAGRGGPDDAADAPAPESSRDEAPSHRDDPLTDPSRGVIARYARGRDYHRVLKKKLLGLLGWLDQHVDGGARGRAYVDTGPILERELAQRAGLGWFGRNTMLIHPRRGSYFFLGVLLVDVELPADPPFTADHCGSCRACLDACPTGALLGRDETGAPRLDARLCISYLTIEHRGPIPEELRPAIGNRVYGCDICQEVCPFTRKFAREATDPAYAARGPDERPAGVEPLPGGPPVEPPDRHVSAETPGDVTAEPPDPHLSAETLGDGTAGPPGVAGPTHPGTWAPSLVTLMRMSRRDWDAFSRGSPIRRAGYAGFKRNVAVAMGNWLAGLDEPPADGVSTLRSELEDDERLVREHAAWALALVDRDALG